MRRHLIWLLASLFSFSYVFADTITLNSADILADGQVFDDDPSANYGSTTSMRTYSGVMRGFVMFSLADLSGISAQNVTSAIWAGYNFQNDGDSVEVKVYDAHHTWSESLLTWTSAQCNGGSNVVTSPCNSTAAASQGAIGIQWVSLNITAILKRALSEGRGNISLLFLTNETHPIGSGQYYYTKEESVNTDKRHYINVTTSSPSPSTPPEIAFYNMTSNGGCTNWNTNKNNACSTTDSTPTVFINTSDVAYCRIGISNLNYTNLGLSRNCTGSGTMQHTCTLTAQDELVAENSFLYIGCKNAVDHENLSSTSGALRIYLSPSDYETLGRAALDSAIQISLAGLTYTVYTDQKVYARNAANQQAVGTFDRVVKFLNKIWAFNVLSGNETNQSFFNVTPVFYAMEFRNTSTVTINQTVQQLINATK